MFLIDLFFITVDTVIASYAGDNTPYLCSGNIDQVRNSLQQPANQLIKRFKDNFFEGNVHKCHMLVSSSSSISMKISGFETKISDHEKQLRVKRDYKLTFDSHVSTLAKKASCKVNTIPRVAPYLNTAERHI